MDDDVVQNRRRRIHAKVVHEGEPVGVRLVRLNYRDGRSRLIDLRVVRGNRELESVARRPQELDAQRLLVLSTLTFARLVAGVQEAIVVGHERRCGVERDALEVAVSLLRGERDQS
jgi:hypothetical protein